MGYVSFDLSDIKGKTRAETISLRRKEKARLLAICKKRGQEKISEAMKSKIVGLFNFNNKGDEEVIVSQRGEIKLTTDDVCEMLNVSYAQLISWILCERTIAATKLSVICKMFVGESCHKMMFGEDAVIPLPHLPTIIGKTVSELPIGGRGSFIRYIHAKYGPLAGEKESAEGLIKERLEELADEHQVPLSRLHLVNYTDGGLGTEVVDVDRRRDQIRRIFESGHEPTVTSCMELSLMFNLPLDYFLAVDYTSVCQVGYMEEKGISIEQRPFILGVLGVYLRLPIEKRRELFADVVTEGIMQGVFGKSSVL